MKCPNFSAVLNIDFCLFMNKGNIDYQPNKHEMKWVIGELVTIFASIKIMNYAFEGANTLYFC